MRGEYCVYGASVLSLISALLLVFANISQLSTGPLVSSLYFVQLDTFHFGDAFTAAAGGTDGLWVGGGEQPMGDGRGLRQFYRYGPYSACSYTYEKGVCNSTMFGYPFQPLGHILADTPTTRGLRDAAAGLIGSDSALSDANYNRNISSVANFLIFVATALCGIALITGFIKTRITFLVATISAAVSALFLLIAAGMWSAVIARNAPIANRQINADVKVGISVTAGAALYLVWVAFAFQTLCVGPYVISFLTFRKQRKEFS